MSDHQPLPLAPPTVDSNWDQTGWKFIGIGIGKQTTYTYESWTCCGHYKRDHEHMKIQCCCYNINRQDKDTFSFCIPCGSGKNAPNQWYNCLPGYCSLKNEHHDCRAYSLGIMTCGRNNGKKFACLGPLCCSSDCDQILVCPLGYGKGLEMTERGKPATCFTPLCCCQTRPYQPGGRDCCNISQCCCLFGYCKDEEQDSRCYSWGCTYRTTPTEKMWCLPGLYKQKKVAQQSMAGNRPAGVVSEKWAYCVYCGSKQPNESCCNFLVCPRLEKEVEVPVPDQVPDDPEWNEHVRQNKMLLQRATFTHDFFGKRYKLAENSFPRQTNQWEEGRVGWNTSHDRQAPQSQVMEAPTNYHSVESVIAGY
jgi:hypothetical protein